MAYYLVKAKPLVDRLPELWRLVDSGEVRQMRPFGQALHESRSNARLDADGLAVWEEQDYCVPPLAQERAAVLDAYSAISLFGR